MNRCKLPLLSLLVCSIVQAELPDGTLVFSNKKSLVGRVARRITGGDQYTHVGIVLDGYVYESDWPKAKRTPVSQYGKRRTTNDYYVPLVPVDTTAMRAKADSMVGQPYRLRNYFRPGSRQVNGTWCSPFVGQVLNAGGYSLSASQYHEPQNILNATGESFHFRMRVRR